MAVSRVSTSSILQGFPKSRSLLIGNSPFIPTDYESIATVSVGAGGTSAITFSNIPSTYQHLQIRYINRNVAANDATLLNFNNDSTGSNYSKHQLRGNGSTASAVGQANIVPELPTTPYSTTLASAYNGVILDVLDYTNTSKYKTVRAVGGYDANGSGAIWLISGLWMNTAAISTIKLYAESGDIAQYSRFALYGIKG